MHITNSLTIRGSGSSLDQERLFLEESLNSWAGTDPNRKKAVARLLAFDANPHRLGNTLNLSDLGLDALPPGIERLAHLQYLNLSGNHLTEFPKEIGLLTNLKQLRLHGNYLTKLPEEIGNLRELEFINLSNNLLEDLPANLHSIKNLQIAIDTSLLSIVAERQNPVGFLFLPADCRVSPDEMGSILQGAARAWPRDVIASNDVSEIFASLIPLSPEARKWVVDQLLCDDHRLISSVDITKRIDELSWQLSLNVWAGSNEFKQEAVDQIFAFRDDPIGCNYALDLSDLNLTELPPGIQRLSQLISLNLSGNYLKCLPEGFGSLTNLQCLNIANNELIHLPHEIGELRDLRTLELRDNQLTELSTGIAGLTQLTYLNMAGNQLKRIPTYIAYLKNLNSLYLGDNQITQIASQIGSLKKLEYLDLSHNQLTHIPQKIGDLSQLTWLRMKDNQLKELPCEIVDLENLQSLDVSGNQLEDLPANLSQRKDLQLTLDRQLLLGIGQKQNPVGCLFLPSECEVTTEEMGSIIEHGTRALPWDEVCSSDVLPIFHAVARLDPDGREYVIDNCLGYIEQLVDPIDPVCIANKIGFVDRAMKVSRLPGKSPKAWQSWLNTWAGSDSKRQEAVQRILTFRDDPIAFDKKLDLSNLDLTEWPLGLEFLTDIERLDVSNNQLTQIPTSIGYLTHLQSLNISHNQLTQLPHKISELTALKVLQLRGNQLEAIPDEIADLDQLKHLDLSHNNLGEIPQDIGLLKSLRALFLQHNPLRQLPGEIKELTELTDLNLSDTFIKDLPVNLSLPENVNITVSKLLLVEIARRKNPVGFLFLPPECSVSEQEMKSIIEEGVSLVPWDPIASSHAWIIFGALAELSLHKRRYVIANCSDYVRRLPHPIDPSHIAQEIHRIAIERESLIFRRDASDPRAPLKDITSLMNHPSFDS
jgi:Leucine-rich repeat (LRR) protein